MSADPMRGLRSVFAAAEPEDAEDDQPVPSATPASLRTALVASPEAPVTPSTTAPAPAVIEPAVGEWGAPESGGPVRRTSMSLPVALLDDVRKMRHRAPPATVVGLLRQGVASITNQAERLAAAANLEPYRGSKAVRSFQIEASTIDDLDRLAVACDCSRSRAAALAIAYARARHTR